jgi:hypothetical protein
MSMQEALDRAEPMVDADVDRPVDLRLSRLHLRMGSLELARAELEALAGASELDTDALIDLAEVRWRTGDVAGAGVAANAYLAAERDDTLALVIAAEASAAAGHPGEARELVRRVIGREGLDLDVVFAGMPRSWMWPLEPADDTVAVSKLFPDAVRPMAGLVRPMAGEVRPPREAVGLPGGAVGPPAEAVRVAPDAGTHSSPWVRPASTIPPAAVEAPPPGLGGREPVHVTESGADRSSELVAASAALAAGDPATAADRLSSLLRSRPDLAAAVLEALTRAAPELHRPAGTDAEAAPIRPVQPSNDPPLGGDPL